LHSSVLLLRNSSISARAPSRQRFLVVVLARRLAMQVADIASLFGQPGGGRARVNTSETNLGGGRVCGCGGARRTHACETLLYQDSLIHFLHAPHDSLIYFLDAPRLSPTLLASVLHAPPHHTPHNACVRKFPAAHGMKQGALYSLQRASPVLRAQPRENITILPPLFSEREVVLGVLLENVLGVVVVLP